ncbi:helix-turn-helix transcriptional regulator [Nocardiopsis sp. CT-R113]|uniref:Helix-turn-helix transcriptional regulator n=1 Tax=Nocardiopsis codii TaxID=3065942 RepID=A0ABU7K6V3_9ACTN|nr:helix-turn-helix transcriptional regulator [Nocardiopsis sp. CT-R113]MEE2037963.1 helix-turn-helix transcriptional regulator [Nocardiopsis sp. CT-R113]
MADRVLAEWQTFGREVRELRRQAALTQGELGEKLRLTGSMVGHLERATRNPNRDHVRKLDALFATGGTLEALYEDANRDGSVPPWFRDSLELERRADTISDYQPILFPGLLQTDGYARVLITARQVRKTPEEIEEVVELRTGRLPSILPRKPALWAVVEQSVVDRIIGDETIMRKQLRHVIDLAEQGTIRFQVIPDDVRHHCGLCAPFRLMSMDSRKVVQMEHTLGGTTYDRVHEFEEMAALFGALQAEALSPRRSLDVLRQTMERLS